MKRKVAPIGLLAAVLAVALFMWMVLPTPTAQANVVDDGVGEWTVNDDPPTPSHNTADDSDPGYDADPDTFQIDSWGHAVLDEVTDPARPARSRGWPVGGQFGWFMSWLLIAFGSRSYFWGSGS